MTKSRREFYEPQQCGRRPCDPAGQVILQIANSSSGSHVLSRFQFHNAPAKLRLVGSHWNGVVEASRLQQTHYASSGISGPIQRPACGMLKPLVALTIVGCPETAAGYSFASRPEIPGTIVHATVVLRKSERRRLARSRVRGIRRRGCVYVHMQSLAAEIPGG